MADKMRLGDLLVQQKIVDEDTVNDAVQAQVGGNRRLGQILLKKKVITEDQLSSVLSVHLEMPLTDIDSTFTSQVKSTLPRYLCTKYGIIPLSYEKENSLLTAMFDPSDQQAISDIEDYTGKSVTPCLAMHSDIQNGIKHHVTRSLRDIFNPRANTALTRGVAAASLVLVMLLGVATYQYIDTVRHGRVKTLQHSTIYEHHDLMVGFDKSGTISFLGHSAFADGYYSVSFHDINTLKAFIISRKKDLSQKQSKWLNWVLSKEGDHDGINTSLATSGN